LVNIAIIYVLPYKDGSKGPARAGRSLTRAAHTTGRPSKIVIQFPFWDRKCFERFIHDQVPRKPAFVLQAVVFEFFACLCEVVSISGVAARNARSKQKEKSGEARL